MQAQGAASAAHLSRLLDRGYDRLTAGDNTSACDAWLQAWEILKQLITPDIRTCDAFDQAYPTGHFTNL